MQQAESSSGLAFAPPGSLAGFTVAGMRHALGNLAMAGFFFAAVAPQAVHLHSSLADLIWIIGAGTMGLFSLVRRAPVTARVDFISIAVFGLVILIPALMRTAAPATGLLAASGIATEVAGVLFSQVARIYLGRSFGILPANRGIVTSGPFRLVRHPVYLGWLVLVLGRVACFPTWRNLALFLAVIPFVMWRIALEEGLLGEGFEYRDYCGKVAWRLVPGVY